MDTIVGQNKYYITPRAEELIKELVESGSAFNIWQAVWIAETIAQKYHPNRKDFLLEQTGLKFRPCEKYEFPPKDIKKISFDDETFTFVLTFLGLYGINSPVPRCYHQQIAVQQRTLGKGEIPLQNFLDIFNNRFYWLYYQAWKKYRFYLFLNEDKSNKIAERINSFTGRGIFTHEPQLFQQDQKRESIINSIALLKFSGIFTQRSRNKVGLKILLRFFFPNIKMNVKEFVPRWIELNDIPGLEGDKNRLGENCFIGKYVKDYTSRICIQIGPIDFEEYLNFLPAAAQAKKLTELLRIYLIDGMEFDFDFIIRADTIATISWNDDRLKLGSTFWLGKPRHEEIKVYLSYEEITSHTSSLLGKVQD